MPLSPLHKKILSEAAQQRRLGRSVAPRALPSRAPDPVSNNVDPWTAQQYTDASVAKLAFRALAWAPHDARWAADPYLKALQADDCGQDGPRSCVLYALNNLKSWRGPVARNVKAELRRRLADGSIPR